jgi:hypothetical protein
MHNKILCSLMITAGVLFGQAALAQSVADNEVLIGLVEKTMVETKVAAIDATKRSMVLLTPDGEELVFANINSQITRFDTLKINDKVTVNAAKSIAYILQKGGGGVRKVVDEQGGDMNADGAGIVKKQTVYNDILSVDLNAGNARVKNITGKIITIPVSNKELLAKAAAGDQLLVSTRIKLVVWAN